MGRPRKKINEMSIANGKIWNQDEIPLRDNHPYSSLSLAQYQEKINKMNLFDLQNHAVEVLVPIKDKRDLLIKNLITEFKLRKSL